MSVIVKGMSMPKGCNECCFCSGYMTGQARILGYVCLASLEKEDSVRGRRKIEELCFLRIPDWCPLVELPERHGRLIDADSFAEWIESVIARQGYNDLTIGKFITVKDVLEAVVAELKGTGLDGYENATTIIEAEGV